MTEEPQENPTGLPFADTKAGRYVLRIVMFAVGVLILRHEIFQSDSAEPLLVFLGLWLCGLPPALFFDGLRKLSIGGALEPPEPPKPPEVPAVEREGGA